jgi:hypothetical protein
MAIQRLPEDLIIIIQQNKNAAWFAAGAIAVVRVSRTPTRASFYLS